MRSRLMTLAVLVLTFAPVACGGEEETTKPDSQPEKGVVDPAPAPEEDPAPVGIREIRPASSSRS